VEGRYRGAWHGWVVIILCRWADHERTPSGRIWRRFDLNGALGWVRQTRQRQRRERHTWWRCRFAKDTSRPNQPFEIFSQLRLNKPAKLYSPQRGRDAPTPQSAQQTVVFRGESIQPGLTICKIVVDAAAPAAVS
jgi:hypothetical protein